MVGEPATADSDQPPTGAEVGNHHWPYITNIFSTHGAHFPEHHDHKGISTDRLQQIHTPTNTGGIHPDHDTYANFHEPLEKDGCRSPRKEPYL
jgi:hypothetical protein